MVKERAPDQEPDDSNPGLEAAAKDLLSAVESKNVKAIAAALQAAFEIADSMPHEEGEHVEPHSYEASKED